jgi:6-phosphogluconolactonase
MAPVGHQRALGRTPRTFTLDSRGLFLFAANQESDTVAVFTADLRTGTLRPLHTVPVSPRPCVVRIC